VRVSEAKRANEKEVERFLPHGTLTPNEKLRRQEARPAPFQKVAGNSFSFLSNGKYGVATKPRRRLHSDSGGSLAKNAVLNKIFILQSFQN